MTASPATADAEGLRLDLVVPDDWFDVLAPKTEDEAVDVFAAIVARMAPDGPAELRSQLVQGLLSWRSRMAAEGILAHGVMSARLDEGAVDWQILVGALHLPTAGDSGGDVTEVMYRAVRELIVDEHAHVELFESAMGHAVGVIQLQEVSPPAGWSDVVPAGAVAATIGLSLAISTSARGGPALLVVGTCVDPEQIHSMAAIVGLIAGHSRFVESSEE